VIRAITSGDLTLPDLAWLNSIPVVGAKLYSGWHSLLEMGGSALMAKVRPYIGTTTTWFVGQAAHIGRFMMHCTLMLAFSALLYWRGEQVALGFVTLPPVWRVNAVMRRSCWRLRPYAPLRWAWW
jgi:predicted PurR-regulated permease PerM